MTQDVEQELSSKKVCTISAPIGSDFGIRGNLHVKLILNVTAQQKSRAELKPTSRFEPNLRFYG